MTRWNDLGILSGNLLLFGGAYSNLQATQALLAQADALGIARANCICTGDMIGYCGDPDAVAVRLLDHVPAIAGNVERQLADGAQDCGCGFEDGSACELASRGWFPFAKASLAGWQSRFAALPDIIVFQHCGRRYAVIHGGVSDIARFIWPDTFEAVFADEVTLLRDQVGPVDGVIAGHSGIAFERRVAGVHWINAGVIGMPPHDERAQTRFAILGEDGVRFHSLDYDHPAALEAMRKAGLMQGYETALSTGIWPSEDVLPMSMRR